MGRKYHPKDGRQGKTGGTDVPGPDYEQNRQLIDNVAYGGFPIRVRRPGDEEVLGMCDDIEHTFDYNPLDNINRGVIITGSNTDGVSQAIKIPNDSRHESK